MNQVLLPQQLKTINKLFKKPWGEWWPGQGSGMVAPLCFMLLSLWSLHSELGGALLIHSFTDAFNTYYVLGTENTAWNKAVGNSCLQRDDILKSHWFNDGLSHMFTYIYLASPMCQGVILGTGDLWKDARKKSWPVGNFTYSNPLISLLHSLIYWWSHVFNIYLLSTY